MVSISLHIFPLKFLITNWDTLISFLLVSSFCLKLKKIFFSTFTFSFLSSGLLLATKGVGPGAWGPDPLHPYPPLKIASTEILNIRNLTVTSWLCIYINTTPIAKPEKTKCYNLLRLKFGYFQVYQKSCTCFISIKLSIPFLWFSFLLSRQF